LFLITGAQGDGKAHRLVVAKEGAKVIVDYILQKDEAQSVVDEIKKSVRMQLLLSVMFSKEDEVKKMFSRSRGTFGRMIFWSTMPCCL